MLADLLKLPSDTLRAVQPVRSIAPHTCKSACAVVKDVHSWAGVDLDLRGLVLSPEDWRALHHEAVWNSPGDRRGFGGARLGR